MDVVASDSSSSSNNNNNNNNNNNDIVMIMTMIMIMIRRRRTIIVIVIIIIIMQYSSTLWDPWSLTVSPATRHSTRRKIVESKDVSSQDIHSSPNETWKSRVTLLNPLQHWQDKR